MLHVWFAGSFPVFPSHDSISWSQWGKVFYFQKQEVLCQNHRKWRYRETAQYTSTVSPCKLCYFIFHFADLKSGEKICRKSLELWSRWNYYKSCKLSPYLWILVSQQFGPASVLKFCLYGSDHLSKSKIK